MQKRVLVSLTAILMLCTRGAASSSPLTSMPPAAARCPTDLGTCTPLPAGDAHRVWLPESVGAPDIGIAVMSTPSGAQVATVTTAQLRELSGRRISFMVLSEDEFQPMTAGRFELSERQVARLPLTHQKVAVIADETAYQLCQSRLETYRQDVESRFDAELAIHHGTWSTAEALRDFIRSLWQSSGITGVIQVGYLPYAMWELPWGEVCPIPLFHEDMDCTFLDRDHDGKYDWHAWGANDGPELWVAYMRPASGRLSDLTAFLDKCHSYYQGTLPVPRRAQVCICRDWGGCITPMRNALLPIYGDSVFTQGGPGVQVPGQTYLDELAHGYELVNVWVHSSPTFHQFDIAPHQYVYDHEVRAQTPGGAFTVIWGCHGMDWNESPSHCFAESYVFGGHNGLADVGVTRSIGTERTEWLFMLLGQLPSLAEAYACYLDSMYDPEWIHSQWPSDTTECFVFDCALFGNPFWIPAGCVGMDESEFRAGTYMRLAAGPNPSADRVNLFCRLPSACRLELVISDAAGREVWSSLDRMARPGVHVSVWDRRDSRGRPVSSGIYFCRLLAGEYRETRKLLLVE